ncbi:MAG: hypothetical protein HEEMFOPI_01499 [Holosporales bacterium]
MDNTAVIVKQYVFFFNIQNRIIQCDDDIISHSLISYYFINAQKNLVKNILSHKYIYEANLIRVRQ